MDTYTIFSNLRIPQYPYQRCCDVCQQGKEDGIFKDGIYSNWCIPANNTDENYEFPNTKDCCVPCSRLYPEFLSEHDLKYWPRVEESIKLIDEPKYNEHQRFHDPAIVRIKGRLINGKVNGLASLYFADGSKYIGYFKDNMYHGDGIWYEVRYDYNGQPPYQPCGMLKTWWMFIDNIEIYHYKYKSFNLKFHVQSAHIFKLKFHVQSAHIFKLRELWQQGLLGHSTARLNLIPEVFIVQVTEYSLYQYTDKEDTIKYSLYYPVQVSLNDIVNVQHFIKESMLLRLFQRYIPLAIIKNILSRFCDIIYL
jgi:hypothetical protein